MINSHDILRSSIDRHTRTLLSLRSANDASFTRAVQNIAIHIAAGSKILICGNGGSAADAQHLATEFVIRYKNDREPIAALALTTDSSILTAAYNDGYKVFRRQVEALGKPGDVLIAISTSGTSENVIEAILAAKERGLLVIGLTGQSGFRNARQDNIHLGVDVELRVPSDSTNTIQEMHIILYHALVEALEEELAGIAAAKAKL